MADKPLVTRDLVESILELRSEAERRLMRNKYYLAIRKLDELLEAIRPLDAHVIEEDTPPAPVALTNQAPAARPEPAPQRQQTAPAPEQRDWRDAREDDAYLRREASADFSAPPRAPAAPIEADITDGFQDDEPLTLEESYETRNRP